MRKFAELVAILVGALVGTPTHGADGQQMGCRMDETKRESILVLPFKAFDQTEGSGWRPLYEARCYEEALDLLMEYMRRNPDLAAQQYILPFHTGQMLALTSRREAAIEYMQKAYQRAPQTLINWNAYVTATVAFLQQDRGELLKQRALIDLQPPMPRSPGLPESMVGKKMNLDIVDRFIQCFDQSYEVAFRDGCERQAD